MSSIFGYISDTVTVTLFNGHYMSTRPSLIICNSHILIKCADFSTVVIKNYRPVKQTTRLLG